MNENNAWLRSLYYANFNIHKQVELTKKKQQENNGLDNSIVYGMEWNGVVMGERTCDMERV